MFWEGRRTFYKIRQKTRKHLSVAHCRKGGSREGALRAIALSKIVTFHINKNCFTKQFTIVLRGTKTQLIVYIIKSWLSCRQLFVVSDLETQNSRNCGKTRSCRKIFIIFAINCCLVFSQLELLFALSVWCKPAIWKHTTAVSKNEELPFNLKEKVDVLFFLQYKLLFCWFDVNPEVWN